jgi:hypothetical protein
MRLGAAVAAARQAAFVLDDFQDAARRLAYYRASGDSIMKTTVSIIAIPPHHRR